MRVALEINQVSPQGRSLVATVRDYVELTKPRLSSLVLFTTAGAMWLSGRSLPALTWVLTLLGTAGTVGAANAFNCYLERESDAFMSRTAKRPLPARRMTAPPALAFAFALGLLSVPMLFGVSWLVGVEGLVALGSYVLVYTPLKAKTHWAMLVGAVPGALPPLMGWTVASGRLEWAGLALFGILFFWQLPHFIAIALFRKEEYRQAGLTSLPLAKGDDVARWHAVGYLAVLMPLSVLPYAMGMAGVGYLVAAVVLGVAFTGMGLKGWVMKGDVVWARRFFFTSLLYLTGLFAALALG